MKFKTPYNLERRVFCGQRFVKDDLAKKRERPSEIVRMDCIECGSKGAMRGTRARSNGHFHGKCENCGAKMHE